MPLSMNQIKACQLLAKGLKDKDVYPKVKVSEGTFYRWKRQKAFKDCLLFLQKEELEKSAAIAAATGDEDELEQSRDDEIEIRAEIKKLAKNSCALANSLIERTIEQGTEDLSPRMIPSLVKAAADAVQCLRDGNDRLTGLEGILDELGKIEKEISAKAIAIGSADQSEAA